MFHQVTTILLFFHVEFQTFVSLSPRFAISGLPPKSTHLNTWIRNGWLYGYQRSSVVWIFQVFKSSSCSLTVPIVESWFFLFSSHQIECVLQRHSSVFALRQVKLVLASWSTFWRLGRLVTFFLRTAEDNSPRHKGSPAFNVKFANIESDEWRHQNRTPVLRIGTRERERACM